MDLGIKDRKALVCASSQGLGLACATSLAREQCSIVLNGRDEEKLRKAVDEIKAATGANASYVVADLNTQEGRQTLADACPDPDILINNNAGPSPGDFIDWGHDDWIEALESNMLAGLSMIRACLPGMRQRKFGRIVNITSAMVKSPRPHMTLSTSARAGLTAASKAISRDVIIDNVTINNMLPERIDTDRQRFMIERRMKLENIDREEARKQLEATIPAGRFGLPGEFGDACAFLCSAQAGFITGQNLHLDGGAYQGLI